MQKLFKKALPHILVLALAFLVTYIYLYPSFKGKVLPQHDIAQWRSGSQEIIDFKENHGRQPHWTNSMFGGMPSYFVSMVHEGNKTIHIVNILYKSLKPPVVQTVASIICFYVLMLSFGFSPWLSILGAFSFAYASFNFVSLIAGHNAKLNAYAFIPLLFAGMNFAFRDKRYFWGSLLFCLGLATNLFFNHFQITFYAILGCGIYGLYFIYEAFVAGTLKDLIMPVATLTVATLIGFGTNASALLVTQEYSEYSIRGKSEIKNEKGEKDQGLDRGYAFEYSYGIGEIATFFIPGIYGGSSNEPVKDKQTGENVRYPLYHGDLGIAGGTIYIGAIIFALAVMGVFLIESKAKWAFYAIAIIGFVLAWGKNLESVNYLLFDLIPGLNKLRSVMMALMISQFAFAVLAIMTLNDIVKKTEWDEESVKKFKYAVYSVAGIMLISLISIFSMNWGGAGDESILKNYGQEAINMLKEYRESLAKKDFFRSLAFMVITIGLVYLSAIKGMFKKDILIYIVIVLVAIDMIGVDARYLNKETFVEKEEAQNFTKTPLDDAILQDKGLSYRVYNLQGNPFTDAITSYHHKSLGGYNPVKIRRYQDVISRHLIDTEKGRFINNPAVLNMLNAKYIMTGDQRMPYQLNPGALGNAWFVDKVKYVKDPDEEIAALNGLEPRNVAVMDQSRFTVKQQEYKKDSTAKITLTFYEPDKLKYVSENSNDGLAVFSEIFYPIGWNIKIDGKDVAMKRVNYLLRALEIPAGKHEIEFYFESVSYGKGYLVSLVCSLTLILALVGGLVLEIFKSLKANSNHE